MSIKGIKKELAEWLHIELGVRHWYHQEPASIEPDCVVVKSFDGDGGYVTKKAENSSWCDRTLSLSVLACVPAGLDAAKEADKLDDWADQIIDTFPADLAGGGIARLVEIDKPSKNEIGETKFRALPFTLAITF